MIKILKQEGYKIILGSVYASDKINPSYWCVSKTLKSLLKPGSIVVLHDSVENGEKIKKALIELLEHAKKKNLQSVTINELTD
jgi:peptidoglycan/xylan/chitin deacetylase (PgdA/CDA1 family)